VSELEKGMFETCQHVCETGCAIYADRPEPCRTFRCQWLRGVLEVDGTVDLELRPDSCGVIFDYEPQSVFGAMYTAWEIEPGASDIGWAKSVIEGLQERHLVMVVTRSPDGERGLKERRFVGPSEEVRWARELMERSSRF
jgi:Fe-S-cluster containining protein